MLSWAVTFLVLALLAALFGFTGIAGTATGFAEILLFLFIAGFVVTIIMSLMRRGGGMAS